MRFVLMIEAQQGLTYDEQLTIARRAEAAGFEGFFRSDHYASFPGPADNPTTDAWAVLAGLSRETSTIRLGVLVSPVTFRLPGNLAKLGATVQEMSGGRLEVGFGAGWNDVEHAGYGFPFPPIGERADRLEEALTIVRGLWEEPDGWSFDGRYYQVADALFRARPEPRPPIIVGGEGRPRSMRIAARFADEFNLTSSGPDLVASKLREFRGVLDAAGRDPDSIRRSAMVGVMIGADETEVQARGRDLRVALGLDPEGPSEWLDQRRARWIVGTPDEARAMVRRFTDAGVERLMLQNFLPRDLEMIDLIGRELVGQV
jgi:F420-dependent oxidoreductase-like protein